MADYKKLPGTSVSHVYEFFPPVFTPGVGNKELVGDHGLKRAMRYLDNINCDQHNLTLDLLYDRYPKAMIDEMVMSIKRHVPDVTETQLVVTILSHTV